MLPKVRAVPARIVTGSDRAVGATDVYIPFDGLEGVPLVNERGEYAHLAGFGVVYDGETDTSTANGTVGPGELLRALVAQVRLRAGGLDLIEPGIDLMHLHDMMTIMHGFDLVADPATQADATATDVDTGEVFTVVRFDDLSGHQAHTNDAGIPLAAFSTARDKEAGLRFNILDAGQAVRGHTNIVQGDSVEKLEVYALIRYSAQMNLRSPLRFRVRNEPKDSFEYSLPGGGAWRALFIANDAASATAWSRTHATYTAISTRFKGELLYSARSYDKVAYMQLLAGVSPVSRVTGALGINPAAPEFLPLYIPEPGVAKGDLPEGPLAVDITQSGSLVHKVHYAWFPNPDPVYAGNVRGAAGLHGAFDLFADGPAKVANRLPLRAVEK